MKISLLKLLVPSLILASGLAFAGYFIGNTLYKSRIALNTATVKGLAERRVKADQANWSVSYSVSGKTKEAIPELYKKAEANKSKILEYLKSNGLAENEITIGVIDYSSKEYRGDDGKLVDETHSLSGSISVSTTSIEKIEPVRSSINKLMMEGIELVNHNPQYLFTRLNDIKPDMLKEATKNARIAADEFAENAGAKVGKIRTARQGGFTIVDVGESYGDKNRMRKDVRVVTTVEFYLED